MSAGLLLRVLLWGWFAAAILAGHRLTLRHLPPAALAGLIPALAGLAWMLTRRLTSLRAFCAEVDVRALVLLQVVRASGLYFLFGEGAAGLPRGLALFAGAGDLIVADRARGWGNARFRDSAREESFKRGLFALATAADAPLPRTRIEYESNRPAKPETPEVRAMAEEVRARAIRIWSIVSLAALLASAGLLLQLAFGLSPHDLYSPL